MQERISQQRFIELARPIIGLSVSRVWRGYGSPIFLELGALSNWTSRRGTKSTKGQVTLDIELNWRVEQSRSIAFGCFSNDRKINSRLEKLVGLQISDIKVEGRLPELVVELSGRFWIRTFTNWEGQPQWTIFFNADDDNDTRTVYCRRGLLYYAVK